MIIRLVIFLLGLVSSSEKKGIVLKLLGEIVDSRDSSVDKLFAEEIMRLSIKSTGNNITAFIVKE